MTPVSQINPPYWGSTGRLTDASLSAAGGSCVTEITPRSSAHPRRTISMH